MIIPLANELPLPPTTCMEIGVDHDGLIASLEATGNYRVLRRLVPRPYLTPPDATPTKLGLFLDLETTGLDPLNDEIIEIAMLPFTYGPDGRIYEVREPFQRLRQPSKPIPPEITELTGITDAMVAGQAVDPAEVTAFAAPAALVIAHNASFDRRFAEQFCETFTTKPWACSMSQVPWVAEGFDGTKLSYLLAGCGLFHDAHRATDDCRAAIEVLARPLPRSGILAFAKLLEEARKPTCRVWAEHSPFELKDQLKARGYRWNGDANGQPRAWYTDIPKDLVEAEIQFLKAEIYQREFSPRIVEIDAYDRFSDRC